MAAKNKPHARLENWSLVHPPGREPYLLGQCYEHPYLDNGTQVRTSPVLNKTDTMAETVNTTYTLGEPWKSKARNHKEYVSQ